MSEPTSVLTFSDLIIEVAHKLGIAYYGTDGTGDAQVPVDAHDLALCKRIVNNAIRMFIHDAPRNGWRWTQPIAAIDLWPSILADTTNKIATSVFASGVTTFTVPTAAFYPSMELRTITITGLGDFTIASYISATSVTVTGDAHTAATKTWSMTAGGDYTLPSTFGGQLLGPATFAASTNRGSLLNWTDESLIRSLRSNVNESTGTPSLFAMRLMTTGTPRRRWELMAYRTPQEHLSLLYKYVLHFDSLVTLTDTSPAPFGHDETVKAACRAQAEKDVHDALGLDWEYYRETALPNSVRVDSLSAPSTLGTSNTARTKRNWRDQFPRPTVIFNP
jgi:hypothetical protein